MGLKTAEVELESSVLLLMDISKIFSKEEWSMVQMTAKGPEDMGRAAMEALSRKLGKDLGKAAQALNVGVSGSLPVFVDRECVTVFVRGVGIKEWT